MTTFGRRRLAIGLVVPLLVFTVLISLVGVDEFVASLQTFSWTTLIGLFGLALAGLLAMGGSFAVVAGGVGLGLGRVHAIVAYTEVNLADNLTPFGQAGGEPVAALFVSRRSERPYEEGLAAVSALDVINFIPAIIVLGVGGVYVAVFDRTVPGELRPIIGGFAIVVICVSIAVLLVQARSDVAKRWVSSIVVWLNGVLATIPVLATLSTADPAGRVDGYTRALGRVAVSRRRIVMAGTLSTLAFVMQGLVLWGAMTALGGSLSPAVAVIIIPISLTAAIIPLPGGGGGIEGVQVILLGALAGISPPTSITAVVLSRGLVYWLPVVVGGLSILSWHARR